MSLNNRTVLALRELADRLEAADLTVTHAINEALSNLSGDDCDRLLYLILRGAETTR